MAFVVLVDGRQRLTCTNKHIDRERMRVKTLTRNGYGIEMDTMCGRTVDYVVVM